MNDSTVIIIISASGKGISDIELGVVTITGSSGLKRVASIKNVSSRNATSHIAVMSMFVLFLGIFTLGIRLSFLLLVLPAVIGVVLGVLGIRAREDKSWLSVLGIVLNALVALFHLFVLSFAG